MFTHEEKRQLTCGVKATLWAILKWNHRGFVIRLSTSVSWFNIKNKTPK